MLLGGRLFSTWLARHTPIRALRNAYGPWGPPCALAASDPVRRLRSPLRRAPPHHPAAPPSPPSQAEERSTSDMSATFSSMLDEEDEFGEGDEWEEDGVESDVDETLLVRSAAAAKCPRASSALAPTASRRLVIRLILRSAAPSVHHPGPNLASVPSAPLAALRRAAPLATRPRSSRRPLPSRPAPLLRPQVSNLGLSDETVRALQARGITALFPIQRLVLQPAMEGRDLIGRAKTGSGKTLAFALPVIEGILAEDREAAGGVPLDGRRRRGVPGRAPRCIVLAPTRELANQVRRGACGRLACKHLILMRAPAAARGEVFPGVARAGGGRRSGGMLEACPRAAGTRGEGRRRVQARRGRGAVSTASRSTLY
jgi:hypothetical protein